MKIYIIKRLIAKEDIKNLLGADEYQSSQKYYVAVPIYKGHTHCEFGGKVLKLDTDLFVARHSYKDKFRIGKSYTLAYFRWNDKYAITRQNSSAELNFPPIGGNENRNYQLNLSI